MIARINDDDELEILPTSHTEQYALKIWKELHKVGEVKIKSEAIYRKDAD